MLSDSGSDAIGAFFGQNTSETGPVVVVCFRNKSEIWTRNCAEHVKGIVQLAWLDQQGLNWLAVEGNSTVVSLAGKRFTYSGSARPVFSSDSPASVLIIETRSSADHALKSPGEELLTAAEISNAWNRSWGPAAVVKGERGWTIWPKCGEPYFDKVSSSTYSEGNGVRVLGRRGDVWSVYSSKTGEEWTSGDTMLAAVLGTEREQYAVVTSSADGESRVELPRGLRFPANDIDLGSLRLSKGGSHSLWTIVNGETARTYIDGTLKLESASVVAAVPDDAGELCAVAVDDNGQVFAQHASQRVMLHSKVRHDAILFLEDTGRAAFVSDRPDGTGVHIELNADLDGGELLSSLEADANGGVHYVVRTGENVKLRRATVRR